MAFPQQTHETFEKRAGRDMNDLSDKAADLAGKATAQITRAIGGAEDAARSALTQGREAGERVNEVAGNMKTAIDKSVKDQPMATLAVAGLLGFVMGALWKS